jgi:REP element-mobilizing transposase RayT
MHPVHVTVRVRRGVPSLRWDAALRVIQRAFVRGADRFGFRLIHFSIQSNHLHLIVEVEGKRSLARGMQGLLVRVARALNRLMRRTGSVFADRHHARALKSPREVRNALVYVLRNLFHHGRRGAGVDECSSGAWFDGWSRPFAILVPPLLPTSARTWLLRVGWKRHGLIAFGESPALPRAASDGAALGIGCQARGTRGEGGCRR